MTCRKKLTVLEDLLIAKVLTLPMGDTEYPEKKTNKHTNIVLDTGLSPVWCQGIMWTNAAILPIRP